MLPTKTLAPFDTSCSGKILWPMAPDESSMGNVIGYFAQTYPDPKCFLDYTTPYTLLVAVVLSAQATDRSVNLLMPILIDRADSPEKMLALGVDGLRAVIASIGLHRRKSEYILALSEKLITDHFGQVPHTLESLVALPGVGRKTANVVLNVIFGQPTIPVDTHVERVSKRLGWVGDNLANPLRVEEILNQMIPLPWKHHIHAWLIAHGRRFCKARSPLCVTCPVQSHCTFFRNKAPQGSTSQT
jgi:endonuclease-3